MEVQVQNQVEVQVQNQVAVQVQNHQQSQRQAWQVCSPCQVQVVENKHSPQV